MHAKKAAPDGLSRKMRGEARSARSSTPVRALALGAALVAAALGATPAAAHHDSWRAADTVMRNGFVYTVDHRDSVAQALAVRDGRIVYVGSDRGATRYIGRATDVVDLHGRMVMPGLQDAHNHALGEGAMNVLNCNLNWAPLTIAQFKSQIQGCLDATKAKEPDGWFQVLGWYRQAMQPSGTEASKADLDALSTSRPIVVYSTDGHSKLANSRALALAGITAATPDPPGGRIVRDADGQPTGILEDSAGRLVTSLVPPPSAEELRTAAKQVVDEMSAQGMTAFMEQIASPATMQAYTDLARSGELTVRASMGPGLSRAQQADPAAAVSYLQGLKGQFDSGPLTPRPNVTVRNVTELTQDGVIQWPAQTASLFKPYLVNKGTDENPDWVPGPSRGPDPYTPSDVLRPLVLALANAGYDPEIHAIGDRAVHHVLDAYEYVRKHSRNRDARLQIAHAELVLPSDYGRFRELNVTPDMGFQWAKPAPDSIDAAENYLGPERFNRMEPEGWLYRAGARLAQGSDWPVDPLDQFFSMEVLVTREGDLGGKYAGPLGKVPGVPIRGAIRAFTINTAYALHEERQTGSLESGKLADLIVLDQNLLRVPSKSISDTKVMLTMVGGKVVYRAPS